MIVATAEHAASLLAPLLGAGTGRVAVLHLDGERRLIEIVEPDEPADATGLPDEHAIIVRAKRSDTRFELLGLGVLVLSMIVLLSLIIDFVERKRYSSPTALGSRSPSRVIDQDSSHRLRRRIEDVSSVVPARLLTPHHPKVNLMYQRSGLKGMSWPLGRESLGG